MGKRSDALEILRRRDGNDPELLRQVKQERLNSHIAQMIYDARMEAGLTQQQLAERIGTRQQVIARLEDADYEGHSLSMLQRIARALKVKIDIRFVPGSGSQEPG